MADVLDRGFVSRYAQPPAPSTITRAASLQESLRAVLGDGEYSTFLQGSYRNDTALRTMNDVDVVAVYRPITRRAMRFYQAPDWEQLFARIEKKLQADPRYADKWKRHDKCITVTTNINVDLVPAIGHEAPDADPIVLYSFGQNAERQNWPRGHYESGCAKNAATGGIFKPAVRLFKRWAKCWFAGSKIAPSYYVECLLFSLPDKLFTEDLAATFVVVGHAILERHADWGGYSVRALPRLAGEGDLLTSAEWKKEAFVSFLETIRRSVIDAASALRETDPRSAKAAWRRAFNGFEP